MSKYYCPNCTTEVDTDSETIKHHCWFCELLWDSEELEKLENKFATVSWTVKDVLDLMPSWGIDKANAWLKENERNIEEQIITEGWQILQNLLPEEEN